VVPAPVTGRLELSRGILCLAAEALRQRPSWVCSAPVIGESFGGADGGRRTAVATGVDGRVNAAHGEVCPLVGC
jgi:hypothetical protein